MWWPRRKSGGSDRDSGGSGRGSGGSAMGGAPHRRSGAARASAACDSGRYATEITVDHTLMWLSTFPMSEEATRAYYAVAWRYGRPRSEMNFSDVETVEEATFVAPEFCVVSCAIEDEDREARRQLRATHADEAAMEKLRPENPDLVKAEEEFFASRGAKKPKTEAGPSTAAGPSAPAINIDDSDSSGLSEIDFDDESGVDWNQLRRECGL